MQDNYTQQTDTKSSTVNTTEQSPSDEKTPFTAAREIVEAIVVAFSLALIFRAYIAEAFVIPTGSMANELMGRHKDICCPECGFRFKVGATAELEGGGGRPIDGVMCPNCRIVTSLTNERLEHRNHPSYSGDRILVSKTAYQFRKPSRWDVFVFMYPGNAQTNYIKRLVGMPNETLRIKHGDIYTQPLDKKGTAEFQIERKPPEKILAVMQNVYDDDLKSVKFQTKTGWPNRWVAAKGSSWTVENNTSAGKSGQTQYKCTASEGAAVNWLMYEHLVPTYKALLEYYQGVTNNSQSDIRPALITDLNAYNFCQLKNDQADPRLYSLQPVQNGVHWVGDLILECDITPTQNSGKAYLQLVKGGTTFTATVDFQTQNVTLSISGVSSWNPQAKIRVTPNKALKIRFANVDQALYCWVNNKLIEFDIPTQYENQDNSLPTKDDLLPVHIGIQNTAASVNHIKLFRDLYYIAVNTPTVTMTDFKDGFLPYDSSSPEDIEDFYRNPNRWNVFADRQAVDFELKPGQYFAMGDNSSNSLDSRLWHSQDPFPEPFVSEDLIIGKAEFVFWPHSYFFPIPNLSDMRRVK